MSPMRRFVDERFLAHRRRSTSLAGMAGALVAVSLFTHHVWFQGVWSWDLFAVFATMVAVKLAAMVWSYVHA
jgi:hypothetical protein